MVVAILATRRCEDQLAQLDEQLSDLERTKDGKGDLAVGGISAR
jgi:hypothetical protein